MTLFGNNDGYRIRHSRPTRGQRAFTEKLYYTEGHCPKVRYLLRFRI